MCGENGCKWKKCLPIVTLADIISVKRTTGYSPFELHFGQQAVLPIDIETNTYLSIECNKISTTEELLEAREKYFLAKEETKLKAEEKSRNSRRKSAQYLDKKMAHKLRNPLQPVISQVNKGPYELEELDGPELTRKFTASHIKRSYPRGKIVHLDSESGNESSEESEFEDSILEEEEIENYP
ncbi:hypothetical protein O181_077884 [Austropuccinia psidii MF-1]|uniref:Uncharacterized protein n=1 Tax=Austropuccinia psidii MF-1 TaxID=1389203 RepID=A0A9Q3FFE3_9BASI|nr:hypothetical protein [Austropuccinia psidii MF-1]